MPDPKIEATEHDAIVSEVMATETPEAEGIQVKDRAGVVHTIRNPELCLVFYPAGGRLNLERGPVIEEEAKLGAVTAPEGAEDAENAIARLIADRLADYARQHDRQIIRVASHGNGPKVAAALSESGFYVIEFPG